MQSPNDQTEIPKKQRMPFLDHLEELRHRLIKSFLAVVLMAAVAGYFSDELLTLIMKPLEGVKLHVTDVTGSFYAYLKVSMFTGLIASLPIVFYQLWSFISPGMYAREKKAVLPMVLVSTLLFAIGSGFCYFVILPLALKMLIGFSEGLLTPIITIGSYISFSGMLLLSFGFAFELPILAYFLGKTGLVSASLLARGRRYAVVAILVISALLTPADLLTQVLLAVPLYILYEISIVIVRLTAKPKT